MKLSAPVVHGLLIATYLVGMWLLFRWTTSRGPPSRGRRPRRELDVGPGGAGLTQAPAKVFLSQETVTQLCLDLASGATTLRVEGWEVAVRRDAATESTRVEVFVPGAVGSFEARVPSSGDMLDAFGGAANGLLLDGLLQVAGDASLKGGAVPTLAVLVNLPGVLFARLAGGLLSVELRGDAFALVPPAIELAVGLARALERRPLEVRVRGVLVQGLAWTGGAAARCPFCHDGLEGELATCEVCRTIHHEECLRDAGGCTLLGCRGRTQAPA